MDTKKSAIVAEGIKKAYKEVDVLRGIDLEVQTGTVLALLGPNGAGKTTMVRILTTLLKPDSGKAFIGGYDLFKEPHKVQSIIGLAGQYAAIDGLLTGLENLEMIGRLYHIGKKAAVARAKELIEIFDLVEAAHRPAKTYSGGMRRRLDLAASILVSPPILFLDEPTTGLDPVSRNTMWEIIRDLVTNGTTLLLTTQYLDEADALANQVAVIDGGTIIARGTPDALKSRVGAERLDISLASSEDMTKMEALFINEFLHEDTTTSSMSFVIDKGDAGLTRMRDIMGKIQDAGIHVSEVVTYKPTLDDVFLQLTNHGSDGTK